MLRNAQKLPSQLTQKESPAKKKTIHLFPIPHSLNYDRDRRQEQTNLGSSYSENINYNSQILRMNSWANIFFFLIICSVTYSLVDREKKIVDWLIDGSNFFFDWAMEIVGIFWLSFGDFLALFRSIGFFIIPREKLL